LLDYAAFFNQFVTTYTTFYFRFRSGSMFFMLIERKTFVRF